MSDEETNSPDCLSRAIEIAEETRLSLRQAELYVLKVEEGHTIREAADRMGISDGNASEKWDAVKQKYRESKRTAETLDIRETNGDSSG